MIHYPTSERVSILIHKAPKEAARKLKERLGIKDNRFIVYLMAGSSLHKEFQQWCKEEVSQ